MYWKLAPGPKSSPSFTAPASWRLLVLSDMGIRAMRTLTSHPNWPFTKFCYRFYENRPVNLFSSSNSFCCFRTRRNLR